VDNLQPLLPPDVHHWEAAQGWTGLGNATEAYVELEKIQPELQAHPLVRIAWVEAWLLGGEWDKARDMAHWLTNEFPQEPAFWLHLAYATRRARTGGLSEALSVLSRIWEQFPGEWMIRFNTACYLCQLDLADEAKPVLSSAIEIGGEEIRAHALTDEDLKPLWPWIKKQD